MSRQRDQVLVLVGEALERGALFELPVVDEMLEPVRELRAHVVEVTWPRTDTSSVIPGARAP
jgi:hypothetical protein